MANPTSVSDLERSEHLGYADSKGVKRVSIFNNGVQVDAAKESGGNLDAIKLKTDNIDVLLSTRTKPADTQKTQEQNPITGFATSAKQLADGHNVNVVSATDFEGAVVAVGTTAVEITFTGTPKTIKISSANTNTGTIYIGKATVTSAGANAMDDLVAGQSLELDLNDTSNAIYAVASVAGQTVYKMALL
jgi:hypothetical protein